ncbi:MAG: alpha-amylase family glycosyl hydrolase [Desulfobacterales bacterium]|nr:alpha-amylase family glycosyl hydrolase [Desulfobacterales bacterium]
MAQSEEKIGTWQEFTANILPRIVAAGYNTLQLMAVQEHPFYGSFGYQVSSFFAASSRFGTPEDLKALVDAAHGAGIAVIMDLVHSHAVSNEVEGLSRFDGTLHQYFHDLPRGPPCGMGLALLRLRQDPGPAFPAVQLPLLAGRIPCRRLPLRRGDQHALPRPRAREELPLLRRLLQPQRRRGRADLSGARQPHDPCRAAGCRHRGRGRERHAGAGDAREGRRFRVRLPLRHGRSGLLDQADQGGPRRALAHGPPVVRADQPPPR